MTKSLILGLIVATATTASAGSVADLSQELSKNLQGSLNASTAFSGDMSDAATKTLDGASKTAQKYILVPVKTSATQTAQSINEYVLVPASAKTAMTGNFILNEVLVPTKNGAVAISTASIDALSATKNHILVPVALSTKNAATDAYNFIVVDVKNFSVEMGRNTYQEVLFPIGQSVTTAGEKVIKYAKITTGEALELAKMSGNATVDTAQFSAGVITDAGNVTGGATALHAGVSAAASSDLSDISADAALATANVSRKMVGLPALERRSKERKESGDALKGN